MEHFKTIRAAILTALEDSETVQSAYGYDRSTFDGFPAVIVSPTENAADYGDSAKDRIVFVFKVRAFYPIKNEAEHEDAETALEAVYDELLGLFFGRGILGTACDWLEPTPGIWYYEQRGEAIYRVAEITLRCIKYIQ